jgi:hypothetical protein
VGRVKKQKVAISDRGYIKDYPNSTELYRLKEAHRKGEARRPVSEKMATVARLRDFERQLKDIRQVNRAKRAAKQIKIEIKTR